MRGDRAAPHQDDEGLDQSAVAVPDPVDGYDPPVMTLREAAAQRMTGYPDGDRAFAPPPVPVPAGRGGDQIIPRPDTARLGRPAPWAGLDPAERRLRLDDVRRALAAAG